MISVGLGFIKLFLECFMILLLDSIFLNEQIWSAVKVGHRYKKNVD